MPAPREKPRRARLDETLVERGLAQSRARAQALILANDVLVNGVPVSRAGAPVRENDEIVLRSPPRFVSRGGEKLDHALDVFGIDVRGMTAADLGASTGGFTDSLLQRGAARVYAIDVGYGQLAERIRIDSRVIVMDRVNARYLDSLPEPIELVSIDVSFIGLRLVLPTALRLIGENGQIVALIKPQFEAGKAHVGRGGVVRDPVIHRRVLEDLIGFADDLGLGLVGLTVSPLKGPAGNVEFLIHLKPGFPSAPVDSSIDEALALATDL
jgi:23S rRNA (cytidine1920-2'-O)/16S rRNA (cytidine1409-2'-O)-methyltransferase